MRYVLVRRACGMMPGVGGHRARCGVCFLGIPFGMMPGVCGGGHRQSVGFGFWFGDVYL